MSETQYVLVAQIAPPLKPDGFGPACRPRVRGAGHAGMRPAGGDTARQNFPGPARAGKFFRFVNDSRL